MIFQSRAAVDLSIVLVLNVAITMELKGSSQKGLGNSHSLLSDIKMIMLLL